MPSLLLSLIAVAPAAPHPATQSHLELVRASPYVRAVEAVCDEPLTFTRWRGLPIDTAPGTQYGALVIEGCGAQHVVSLGCVGPFSDGAWRCGANAWNGPRPDHLAHTRTTDALEVLFDRLDPTATDPHLEVERVASADGVTGWVVGWPDRRFRWHAQTACDLRGCRITALTGERPAPPSVRYDRQGDREELNPPDVPPGPDSQPTVRHVYGLERFTRGRPRPPQPIHADQIPETRSAIYVEAVDPALWHVFTGTLGGEPCSVAVPEDGGPSEVDCIWEGLPATTATRPPAPMDVAARRALDPPIAYAGARRRLVVREVRRHGEPRDDGAVLVSELTMELLVAPGETTLVRNLEGGTQARHEVARPALCSVSWTAPPEYRDTPMLRQWLENPTDPGVAAAVTELGLSALAAGGYAGSRYEPSWSADVLVY
ncbi:MAG: hypothetical protein ACI8PZ_003272 [Myxococcota bacterium]|jgi:hypothetical protein